MTIFINSIYFEVGETKVVCTYKNNNTNKELLHVREIDAAELETAPPTERMLHFIAVSWQLIADM